MTTLQRFRQAPVTEKEIKLNIFNANEKKKTEFIDKTIIFENDKYLVELKGFKLTQTHRDILDIALYHGDNSLEKIANDGKAIRLFSLYDIQKNLGHKFKNNNNWIEKKITEMQQSLFKITDNKTKDWIQFSIIDVAKYSDKHNRYAIIISDLYLAFFEKEISINYKQLLPNIINLKHAQTKAVVRYLLSFQNSIQINIDNLLKKIGISGSKRNLEKIRKNVIEELKEVGYKFGIELIKTTTDRRKKSDYTIKYIRPQEVKIFYPLKTS